MNATLIKNHNNRVAKEDTVFFLGDFCFKNSPGGKKGEGSIHKAQYYIDQLNGNFVFIKGNHDCFSYDTRLLTKEGYKNYDQVKKGELIPTVNLDTNCIEYEPIEEVIFSTSYRTYGFNSKTVEGEFTSNHKQILIGTNQKRNNIKKIFKEYTNKAWARKSPLIIMDAFKSGNKDYNISDNWLKLLAWIYTDGGISKHGYITLYQSKEKGKNTIEKILSELQIEHKKTTRIKNTKEICGKKIKQCLPISEYKILATQSKSIREKLNIISKKILPEWIIKLSDKQTKTFIGELIKGDGHIQNSGTKVLWGTKNFLEQVMGLCVTHNISCNLVKTTHPAYYLSIHKERKDSLCGVKHVYQKHRYEKITKQNMWCVNVKNHNIFIEKNGKTMITGNSNNSLKTIIESATIFYGGKQIHLVHDPKDYKPGMLNFAGHVHEKWKFKIVEDKYKTVIINVGCDVNNFRPVSYNEIMKEYRKWVKKNDN